MIQTKKRKLILLTAILVAVLVLVISGMNPTVSAAETNSGYSSNLLSDANWNGGIGNNTTTNQGGEMAIYWDQTQYKTPIPFGNPGVSKITVEYSVTNNTNWLCFAFLPRTSMIGAGEGYWMTGVPGISFMMKMNGSAVTPVYLNNTLGWYNPADLDISGNHTLEMIKRDAVNAYMVYDGEIVFGDFDWTTVVDASGNTYFNVDDATGQFPKIKNIYIDGNYKTDLLVDANWNGGIGNNTTTNQGGEMAIFWDQTQYKTPIPFGNPGVSKITVEYSVTNNTNWLCFAFLPRTSMIGAGEGYWMTGVPGISFMMKMNGSAVTPVYLNNTLGWYNPEDLDISGNHTLELIKRDALNAYMVYDGEIVFGDFDWTTVVDASGNTYFNVDDATGQFPKIKNITVNDYVPIIRDTISPVLTINGAPTIGTQYEEIDLTNMTYSALDDVDGDCTVLLTVKDTNSDVVTVDANNKFIPLLIGDYKLIFETKDKSNNKTISEKTIAISENTNAPILTLSWNVAQVVKINSEITLPTATALLNGNSVDVTVTVKIGNNLPVEITDMSYTPTQVGSYTVTYKAGAAQESHEFKAKSDADPANSILQANWSNNENWTISDSSKVYNLPLDFSNTTSGISLKYDLSGSEGSWITIGFMQDPNIITSGQNELGTQNHENDGVYFYLFSNGGYIQYVVSTGTNGIFAQIGGGLLSAYSYTGAVCMDIEKNGSGLSLKVNGVTEASSQMIDINLNKTMVDLFGNTYLSISAGGTTMTMSNMTYTLDKVAPTITPVSDFSGTVGVEITVPTTTATDVVDDSCTVSFKVLDSLGHAVTVIDDKFIPELLGDYQITYTAFDKSFNKAAITLTVTIGAAEGSPEFTLVGVVPLNGRQDNEITLSQVTFNDPEATGVLSINVKAPSNSITVLQEGTLKFTPSEIGLYEITYSATNASGTITEIFYIDVKIDRDASKSMDYDVYTNTANWSGDGVSVTNDGLKFNNSSAYYINPIKMDDGLVLNFSFSEFNNNSWFGVSLMQKPGASAYAQVGDGTKGFKIMFQNQNGTIWYRVECTVDGANGSVSSGQIANGVMGQADSLSNIQLRIFKYNQDDTNYFNSILLFVNGTRAQSFSLFGFPYSDMVDSENFTYMSVCYFGSAGNWTLTSMETCDFVAPTIYVDESKIPETAKIGDWIDLSDIYITDNTDENPIYEIRVWTPVGDVVIKSMLVDGKFQITDSGYYTLIVYAKDYSGNDDFVVYEIKIEQESLATQGCKGSMGETLGLLIAVLIYIGIYIFKDRKNEA